MNHSEHLTEPESVETEKVRESALGLTRSDQLFLVVIIFLCAGSFGMNRARSFFSSEETISVQHFSDQSALFQIEINSATWVEWMQLDGVGEMTARKIVADLEMNGPFQNIANVTRVKGIGPATLAKMEPHLRCDSCAE